MRLIKSVVRSQILVWEAKSGQSCLLSNEWTVQSSFAHFHRLWPTSI